MKDPDQRIAELFIKYLEEDISDTERLELESWRNLNQENKDHFDQWVHSDALIAKLVVFRESDQIKDESRHSINWNAENTVLDQKSETKVFRLPWKRLTAVASALLLGISGWVWYHHSMPVSQVPITIVPTKELLPGGNKAVLTLADGSTITLDSAKNGVIAQQGGSAVIKSKGGQIVYNASSRLTKSLYNIISTPAGGQFQVVLPDGSKVWLNNASSLRFQTAFTGGERVVELSGEAYFDVVTNPAMPFRVKEGSLTVEVLGTHFNIKAYSDEVTKKTTLLEGAVKVVKGGQTVFLAPGDQSIVSGQDPIKVQHGVDVEQEVAWKNGLFNFNGEDLPVVMLQIARWYDVKVEYQGKLSAQHLSGKIQRNLPLSRILKGLENSQRHFTMEGRKIIVTP